MNALDQRAAYEDSAPKGARCFYCGGPAIRLSTISPEGPVAICSSANLTKCIDEMRAHGNTPHALRGQA